MNIHEINRYKLYSSFLYSPFAYREIGSDIAKGETILKAGLCLGPAEVGLLATMGITQVECFAKPVVGVMSTGTEVLCILTHTVTSVLNGLELFLHFLSWLSRMKSLFRARFGTQTEPRYQRSSVTQASPLLT